MQPLTGTPSLCELVVPEMIRRLQLIRPPLYFYDLHDAVYDVFQPPSQIPLPGVSVTTLPEIPGPAEDAAMGGRLVWILPLLLEFTDTWNEGQVEGNSMRRGYAERARADMKRGAAGDAWILVPSLEGGGFQVRFRLKESSVLLGAPPNQVSAEALVHAEYEENWLDPRTQ